LIGELQKWAEKKKDYLNNYITSTGEITSSLRSGERYLEFSEELGLVSYTGSQLINTIDGTVLSKLDNSADIPYKLPCELRCFLLKRILERDFDFLIPIASLIIKREKINFHQFKEYFSKHLKTSRSSGTPVEGLVLLREMDEKWKNPEEYFREHIFASRVEWFLDLELLDWNRFKSESRIQFTDNAVGFMAKMEHMRENHLTQYLDNEYYAEFSSVQEIDKLGYFARLPDEVKRKKTMEYLKLAFNRFDTSLTRSLSSRSFFEYTTCHALCQEKLVCERKDIERVILEFSASGEMGYRYRKVREVSESGSTIEAGYITAGT
jgi:hypothetical protein